MRKSIVAAAAVLAVASFVWAAGRPGVVRTKDGGVYDGTIDESEETVTVNVRGIDTAIPRANVLSVSYGDFESRWNEAYAKLDKSDAAGRVTSARRAFDERRYDLAEKACRDALAVDPNSAEAADLLKLTINQRRLEHSATTPRDNASDATPPGSTGPVKPAGQWTTLSASEINRIKQLELKPDDAKVRFSFENNVRKVYYQSNPQLIDTYRKYEDFIKQPQSVQAMAIITNGGDLVKDVHVTNDPDVFVQLRTKALPLVLQGCATSTCHGGTDSKATAKFAIISPAPDAAAMYTDFYVLTTTKVGLGKNAVVSTLAGEVNAAYLVDRTHPDSSLILQYGLADSQADFKHPKVAGYNGIYPRGKSDPKYAQVLNWIQMLNPVAPDYGVSFTLKRNVPAGPAPTSGPVDSAAQAAKSAADAIRGAVNGAGTGK